MFEITVNSRSYHVESDEVETWATDPHWSEGYTEDYDPGTDAGLLDWTPPVDWAVQLLRPMMGFEPSSWPVQGAGHEWLSGTYRNPYTTEETETTVRLTGEEWTVDMRREVFERVTK